LPQPSMSRHASEMSEDLEKRMLAVIIGALAAMNYRQPSLNAGKRDVACKAARTASEALVAALQADGWKVVPPVGWSDAIALNLLRESLASGVQNCQLKPPQSRASAAIALYHHAVAGAVVAHLSRCGWRLEPPANLRKAAPRAPH
jgi:hypothetical protein